MPIAEITECANPARQAHPSAWQSVLEKSEQSENTAFCGPSAKIDVQKKGYCCQGKGGEKRSAQPKNNHCSYLA